MNYFTKAQVGRGAIFLYIENIAAMFSGYIFWLIVTKITTPEVIGISATIVSFSSIIVTIVNMGVPISIQRFLGRTFVKRSIDDTRVYVKSSLVLLSCSIMVSSILIIIGHSSIVFLTKIDLDASFLTVTLLLVVSTSLDRLLRGIIIATLNTKAIPIAAVASSAMKFVLSFLLIIAGFGAFGLTIGIASYTILESILLFLAVARILKREQLENDIREAEFWHSSWEILKGGFANWVPNLITSLGAQLGTILVFGSYGANSAGLYFIAYSIYAALAAGMNVIFSISYPVLTSVDHGREAFSWRTTKLALLISVPFSMSILFYTSSIMELFGTEYVSRSYTLEILLLSMAPVALMTGITNLVYSYGHYRQVMLTGVATSLPRTLLYFVLVPLFGGTGAAISFTVGSLIGLIVSVIYAARNNFSIMWKQVAIIFFAPLLISYAIGLLHMHYVISILMSIIASYVALACVRILDDSDLKDILSVLPKSVSGPLLKAWRSLKHLVQKKS